MNSSNLKLHSSFRLLCGMPQSNPYAVQHHTLRTAFGLFCRRLHTFSGCHLTRCSGQDYQCELPMALFWTTLLAGPQHFVQLLASPMHTACSIRCRLHGGIPSWSVVDAWLLRSYDRATRHSAFPPEAGKKTVATTTCETEL